MEIKSIINYFLDLIKEKLYKKFFELEKKFLPYQPLSKKEHLKFDKSYNEKAHVDTSHSTKKHFKEKDPNVHYLYDINNMTFYYYGKCDDTNYADFYIISPDYYKRVISELSIINILLENVHKEHPIIPYMKYKYSEVKFNKFSDTSNMFTMFCHHPVTYNLKENENPYSVSIRFGEEQHSFFDLYYNRYGYIDKMRLVCWNGETLYLMKVRVYNKNLQIVSVYKKWGTGEERIFDIDYELREIRKKEYEWICKNIPELAPKSLSAYTRMKNSRTDKYIKIEQEAYKKGKVLNDGILP